MQLSELFKLSEEERLKIMSKLKKDELIELLNSSEDFAEGKGQENISKLKKDELIELLNSLKNPISKNNSIIDEIPETSSQSLNGGYKITNEDDDIVEGILEVLPDGYGFLRGENYLSSPKDVYISPVQIKRFRLSTGDKIKGIARFPKEGEKFPALIFVGDVNRRFSRFCNEKEKL